MKCRLISIAVVAAGCAAAAPPALAASLTATTPPAISGTAAVGQTLTCNNGTWPTGAGGFTYEWQIADTSAPIGTKSTLKLGDKTAGLAVDCVVSATSGSSSGTATSPAVSVAATSPTIKITKETASKGTLTISGKITPAAAAKGGVGSLILYRMSSSGPQQLTFDETDTVPASNGTFTLVVTGEPAGRHTYALQYVPGLPGFVSQVTITRKFRIRTK
jgi:hypothetical protein